MAKPLPHDDAGCGWYNVLPPPGPARRVAGDETADWVVLGAGITGLAAARRLAELAPDARILLIEAQRVGYGATGRNAGFILETPHYTEGWPKQRSERLLRIFRAGADYLREAVARHDIDCQWTETGQLKGAHGDVAMPYLEGYCQALDDHDLPYQRLDADGMAAVTGTTFYQAGVNATGMALMQPAALARGLAGTLPGNAVEVCEESPVTAIHPGSPVRIECAGGTVTTGGLLLTTNIFTPSLGHFGDRVFPLWMFASLSRRLTDDEVARLGGAPSWGLVPAHPAGTTVRHTPDHRILIRNTVRYRPDLGSTAAMRRHAHKHHVASFRARFPMLEGVELEHTWAGGLCMTMNGGTIFGQTMPGVFTSIAYNGLGLTRGTASGKALAELALGHDSDLLRDVQAMPEASTRPPDPLLAMGVRGYISYMQWRGGAER